MTIVKKMLSVSTLIATLILVACDGSSGTSVVSNDEVLNETQTFHELVPVDSESFEAITSLRQGDILVGAPSGSKTSVMLILGASENSVSISKGNFSPIAGGCMSFWLDTALNHSHTTIVFDTEEQLSYHLGCAQSATVSYSEPEYDNDGTPIGQSVFVPASSWVSFGSSHQLQNIIVNIEANGYKQLAARW